jgi:hypothetical protein
MTLNSYLYWFEHFNLNSESLRYLVHCDLSPDSDALGIMEVLLPRLCHLSSAMPTPTEQILREICA